MIKWVNNHLLLINIEEEDLKVKILKKLILEVIVRWKVKIKVDNINEILIINIIRKIVKKINNIKL